MSFTDHDRIIITQHLADHPRSMFQDQGLQPAAVVLLLAPHPESGQLSFIITKRASDLRRHSGQWALPGGRIDPGETANQAGLRELDEELGITIDEDRVLGTLDDCVTRSGYVITPIVVWGETSLTLTPAPDEVASAYFIQRNELFLPHVPQLSDIPESNNPVLSIPFDSLGTTIYAPTAAIIYQFREVALMGRLTRIDQFEQPLFAWK